MHPFRKKVYAAAGYTTTFFGPGRKEFSPKGPMPPFEKYLQETGEGSCAQVSNAVFDEGVIANFMSARFLQQAHLGGFLPFMVPTLQGKPCTAVEGACGSGGRAIYTAVKSVLSDLADSVFVAGFEIQNTMKPVYGADVLAGAAYYNGERKQGHAYFFPGIFDERAGAYFERYGEEVTRQAMARWYEQSIHNARKNPKAQEYHNVADDLFGLAMTPPNAEAFLPRLNGYNCSKVSDGAASVVIASEEGLSNLGVDIADAIEIVAVGAVQDDLTVAPKDPTAFATTKLAAAKALEQAGITTDDIGLLELHDCFDITTLLALEAIGFAEEGQGGPFILEGTTAPDGPLPTNPSGGLGGFGHPTGASGVRQLVDLLHQYTGKAENPVATKTPYGLMTSMGGNDKTITCVITKG